MGGKVEIWPSLAEFFIYDEAIYRMLAGDDVRDRAYRNACTKVLKGKTVLEIGPGAELVLSRLCLDAGAEKVYAVEILEETWRLAKQRIAELRLEDRIVLIRGDATRINLPEQVDYCVSEIVGPIGGAEGAARIINGCRRFLRDPSRMLPARTLTMIAAAHLDADVVDGGFSDIGMHYVDKTFQQVGYPFDLRVCVKNFPKQSLLSTAAHFEDLDYTRLIDLEDRHDITLEFTQHGDFTGFLVWLRLFVDRDEIVDVLDHQQSWLPVYFPLSRSGWAVKAGDRFEGTVTRTLGANGLNPDYAIKGTLHRLGNDPAPLAYDAPHFEKRFRSNWFYSALFAGYAPQVAAIGAPAAVANASMGARGVALDWPDISIPRLFETQAEKTPDRIALIHGGLSPRRRFTFREVDEKSSRLAHVLQERGVGPEVAVGVFLERSPETIIALLAILKAGGAYLPLDLAHPLEHIRFVLDETRASIVLIDSRVAAKLPDSVAQIICIDDASNAVASHNDERPISRAGLDHLALILYTSGSTGKPKGVALAQRQLLNRFHWLWQTYPFADGERAGQRTTVSFIPSLFEMLGALLKGTPTVVLPDNVAKDPARLLQVLAEEEITRVAVVPTLLKLLLDAEPDLPGRLPRLKLWFIAGEILTPDLYERFLKAYPGAVLSNDYGSTELNGVLAFDSRWSADAFERVPVGRPIGNCQAYILDDDLNPVLPGEVGLLYVGGAPVSRGYIGHPDWTAEKFIPDPFSGTLGARLYNMGDLAAWRPDGMIELHGRSDHLVKIRGTRVELAGIESVLASHPQVREAAVIAHRKASGEQDLVAFVALRAIGAIASEDLRDFLRERLPDAMVPSRLMPVEALPRTPNGKIDRPHLPALMSKEAVSTASASHGTRSRLRDMVAEVLEVPALSGADDEQSFARLGVHSVAMVELARKISQKLSRDISVTVLFNHFSIVKLADHLTQNYGTDALAALRRQEPARAEGPAPAESPGDEQAIAIVGYSGRFPQAPDCETFWKSVEAGADAIREVPPDRWDVRRFYDPNATAPNKTNGKWGGFLEDADKFDPLFFNCSPREARWMDPQQRLFIEECWKALEHAGYSSSAISNRPVGVFAGIRPSDYLSERHDLGLEIDSLTLLGNDSAILASRVAHFLNLKGPSLSVDTSCSSSLTAVHLACRSLRDGECDLALAGGAAVMTAPDFFIQATKAGMLSPTGRCRTFDRDADGFVPGEGAGIVVLKTLTRARRDGDRVHGVIRAIGLNQDGHTGGLTIPNTLSQTELEKSVYLKGGVDPETIGYVEAHGTGTALGDPIEVQALTDAFSHFTDRKRFCRIGSVKENIGHLAAAAGVAGLIKVLLALRHGTIPPNVHVRHPNPNIDFDNSPFWLDAKPQAWAARNGAPRRAAVSSFGFSGTNVHLVIEEGIAEPPRPIAAKAAYLFTLSAKTEIALECKRRDLEVWLDRHGESARAEDVSYTLNVGRSHFKHRLWWVASSLQSLKHQMADRRSSPVSGPLASLGSRYAAGHDPDWLELHAGESRRIVDLPFYPFERKRYWHKERVQADPCPLFRPRWAPTARRSTPRSGQNVLVIRDGASEALVSTLTASHADGRVIVRDGRDAITSTDAATPDIVYFLDNSTEALTRLFRVVKAFDPRRSLDLVVVTGGALEDTSPQAASLAGFCRSLARERPGWEVRCVAIDGDAADGIRTAPSGITSLRAGVCYEHVLEAVTLPQVSTSVFREGGVYLIVGGAGGIGLSLATYLAERYGAKSVLVGRRHLTPELARAVEAAGALYLQADVSDQAAIAAAVQQARTAAGAIHGVFHCALQLNDASLVDIDEAEFAASLRAKIDGTLALRRALDGTTVDFFVCFSSVQSFLGNAGQASYAAASAFQDAWVRSKHKTENYPVQTINWGFWGEVGAVATDRYRKLLASQGVDSIRVDEGMETLERVLAAGHDQVVAVKGDADFLKTIGVVNATSLDAKPDEWISAQLHQAFATMGVFTVPGERHTFDGLKQRLSVAPRNKRLFDGILSMLAVAGVLTIGAGEVIVRRGVSRPSPLEADARVRLVEACLARFPELLRGEIAAPEVLFPGGSMQLVEDLYTGLPETDAIRDEVIRTISERRATGPIRILEIGAGTGATSAVVLAALKSFAGRVSYSYTDISPAFTQHGRRRFLGSYPFAEFSALDIENEPAGQGFEARSFDIIIAANALHATRDIRRTLRHVRSLLKDTGRLILHEQTAHEPFLTVTFGWLDGWWLYEDERSKDGPLLDVDRWQSVLAEAGFGQIAVPDIGGGPRTQHVLVVRNGCCVAASEKVAAAMRSVLELNAADLDTDKPFSEYGVDSILAQALVNTLNRDLPRQLKASDLYNYPTIGSLSAHIEGALGGAAPQVNRSVPREVRALVARDQAPVPVDDRIAIIGMSGRFPGADTVDEFWSNLAAGRSAISEVPASRWNADAYYDPNSDSAGKSNSKWGGFLSDIDRFDPQFFKILPREAEWMDPQQRLFLQEAWRALEDAGYPDRALNGRKCGVFVGCKEGDYQRLFTPEQTNPYHAVGNTNSILAARISYCLNLKGPSLAVDTACSSSLVAVYLACERLRLYPDEMALAGGVSLMCTPHTHILLGKGGMLSPDGRCKTFSQGADGFVPAEAVGVVVLKPLKAALRDGDRIHGVILGIDVNQDGKTNGITAPSAPSQAALEREVYAKAGITPDTIGYVETHGTGTRLGDPIEVTALADAFGRAGDCSLGSVKTNIGHALAAAGMASLIKTLLCLKHRKLVPTLNIDRLNEEIDFAATPLRLSTKLSDWTVTSVGPLRAAVSSFGFSGTNAHMVVEEAPDRGTPPSQRPAWLIPLSAKTPAALERRIDELLAWVQRHTFDLADLAYTLLRGRSHFLCRSALVVRDAAELVELLEVARSESSSDAVFLQSSGSANGPALKQWGADLLEQLRNGSMSADLYRDKLLAAADLYAKGYELDWDRLLPDQSGRCISLPTYPFDGQRYWVPDAAVSSSALPAPNVFASKPATRILEVLTQSWSPRTPTADTVDDRGAVMVLTGKAGRSFAEELFNDRELLVVSDPAALAEGPLPRLAGCIDLTAMEPAGTRDPAWDEAVWRFLQVNIGAHRQGGLRLLQVCHKLHDHRVTATYMDGAGLAGLYRMLGAEYQRVNSRVLDTDTSLHEPSQLKAQILAEWTSAPPGFGVSCYRGGARFEPALSAIAATATRRNYPSDRTLLITGGTRGVGAAMARYMVANGVRKLAIMGHEPLPDPSVWNEVPADTETGRKIASLRALEEQGAAVEVHTGALTDRTALIEFGSRVHRNLGPVFGVLHCAGLASTEHRAFVRKPISDIRAVCEPKIEGLQCLDAVFGGGQLDFFVLFSSVAASLPELASGQSDYAMANTYMDLFAQQRFRQGKTFYRSIQWPTWHGTGMGQGATSAAYDATGLYAHTQGEGFRLFEQCLAFDRSAVTLPCVHGGELRLTRTPLVFEPPVEPASTSVVTLDWLRDLFARELRMEPRDLDPDRTFADFGIDSILMVELVKVLERLLVVSLAPTILFEHDTLKALSMHLHGIVRELPAHALRASAVPVAATAEPAVAACEPAVAAPITVRTASRRPPADIAIIGLSCRFPGAPDTTSFWDLLTCGERAIGKTPPERWGGMDRNWFGGFIDDIHCFDPDFFKLADEDACIMDPQARIILEESARALYDAGYDEHALDGEQVGVYIGARSIAVPDLDLVQDAPNPILGFGQNYIAANVSRLFNFRGPSFVVDSACSSALLGMSMAVRALQSGEIDYGLVGGVNVFSGDTAHRLFASRKLLRPDATFHLFDRRADGVVLGEGAGAVLLKPLAAARADGDRILGVIKGIAVNNSGRTAGPNAPNLQAQKDVVAAALLESGKQPGDITAIEASGAGSEVNDLLELKSLASVLGGTGGNRQVCYLGSVKANIGHLLSAAGLASFIKTVLSLNHGEHPPFPSAIKPLLHFDFESVGFAFSRERTPWKQASRAACITSFPDGGTNCSVIVESFSSSGRSRTPLPGPHFNKRSLIENPVQHILDRSLALSGVRKVAAGDDFWGLSE